jgi:hypothetical protein
MRRLVFASMICAGLLPGFALAQAASPTPPAPPPPGADMPPPGPGPDMPPPGGHHHWDHGKMMQKMQDKFNAANTTHDGHLTLAQAKAAGLRPVVDHFSEIDTAHHGYVTFNEVQAWHMDDMAKHLEERAAQLRAQD